MGGPRTVPATDIRRESRESGVVFFHAVIRPGVIAAVRGHDFPVALSFQNFRD